MGPISSNVDDVECDGSRAKEGSVDPLEVPLGPMTRARATRFKEALHVLIRDAHVEEARVFNSKKGNKDGPHGSLKLNTR